jgi:hypothetical protein
MRPNRRRVDYLEDIFAEDDDDDARDLYHNNRDDDDDLARDRRWHHDHEFENEDE